MTQTEAPPAGSLRAGWRALVGSPDRVLVPTLVLGTVGIAVHVVLQHLIGIAVAGSRDCGRQYLGETLRIPCGPSDQRAQLALVVAIFALVLVGHLVVAGIYRAGLDVVDGNEPGSAFNRSLPWPRVLGASAVLATLLTVSTVFLVLPVLVLGFFARYALLFVIEQGQSPFAALASSCKLVAADLVGELGFVLRAAAALLLGALLLGVGLYVVVPVVLLAQVQRFRVATADSWLY
ncbi:putative membrane protein [Marmoricola sp. OAE513]|uniref:hypothetical protein n=1 Tax=Marmoricola sp. OAE513 TaxID=2817894 RepID=UPI001AE51AE1